MFYARSDGLCFGLRQAITAQLHFMFIFKETLNGFGE
jgi:hypothetical protein